MDPIQEFIAQPTTIGIMKCPHCKEENEYDVASIPVSANNYGFFAVYCKHCGRRYVSHAMAMKYEIRAIRNCFEEIEEL